MSSWAFLGLAFALGLLLDGTAWTRLSSAEINLPAGFTVTTHITGSGFDPNRTRNVPGLPAIVSLAFDYQGNFYLARTANRLREIYGKEMAAIYRVPAGGAKVSPKTETRFLLGPPLPDPDEVAVNRKGEVLVSTSNRAEGYGSVYRLTVSGSVSLFAGGRPTSGSPPLLRDPDGIAFDEAGNVYVIDSALGVVVKLDSQGRVINPRFLSGLGRGRTLTFDSRGYLWIGSDGTHDSPDHDGSGRIYQARLPEGQLQLVHSGPLPSGMSLSPSGYLFVAQRRSGKIFVITPEGRRIEFASFTGLSALRTLAFPPVTPETKKAGIAGNLFVIVFPMLDFPVRQVVRITGPFDTYVKQGSRDR